jgi:glycosyltransferase involved in cell wall biosynthesis
LPTAAPPPDLTVVIPTRDRPALLPRAVASALAQSGVAVEVVVVDDGSHPPARLRPDHAADPRVRLIRLDPGRGGAAARNAGIAAARARHVANLDDDDELLPGFAALSLAAIAGARLPPPVASLCGIEVVGPDGRAAGIRLPPAEMPRGLLFQLEEPAPGASFLTKQTVVAERGVLLAVGGYDEAFPSRVSSELMLRLNPVCSLVGARVVGYRLHRHDGPRVSSDKALRSASFRMLETVHAAALAARPGGHARLLVEHARVLRRDGDPVGAVAALARAAMASPRAALRALRPSSGPARPVPALPVPALPEGPGTAAPPTGPRPAD